MSEMRELIDTELETVAGGDYQALIQNIDAHQYASANANAYSSKFGVAVGGVATAVNVGGTHTNFAQNGG
jgi:hypothetical protein